MYICTYVYTIYMIYNMYVTVYTRPATVAPRCTHCTYPPSSGAFASEAAGALAQQRRRSARRDQPGLVSP